jgi:two-component system sensor histidine kinase KdpD
MRKPEQASLLRRAGLAGLESLAAVGVSTGLVAALDTVTPTTGLSVIYLLAVLFVATRHGEVAALGTAVLGVLALNFFFIEPRYQLAVHDPDNVVALVVLLIAAVVVGRLATTSRERAAEAVRRARVAVAREREAAMLTAAASSLLEGADVETQLRSIEQSAGEAGASPVRVQIGPVPTPEPGELAVRLSTSSRPAWLYLAKDSSWAKADQDRVAGALARLIDVAFERERLGAQAAEAETTRRAEVAKTAILHAISHDFRSPLTAISTAASGLKDDDISSVDRGELVSVIETEAARLSRLVDDLLDLSRIEADAVNPNPDWCDLRDVVARASAQVRSLRGEYAIELALPELPLVRADPAQLERVFANLIENAVSFSPPDTPVRVSGATAGERVVVRVMDRGPGVPRSERVRIFQPFVRGRDSSRGSGLGLAICRGFVEANGGRIVLQTGTSEETSFTVSFPIAHQPAVV